MSARIRFGWQSFVLDGTFTIITLAEAYVASSALVLLNGIPLKKDTEYTENAGYLTISSSLFDDADKIGWEVAVHYAVAETITGTLTEISDFKEQMAEDAVNCFANELEFAEPVVYTPSGGVAVTINAIVVRNRLSPDSQSGGKALLNQVELYIANYATGGVTAIAKGYDAVSLPKLVGGSPESWLVIDILGQDDGMWHLLARK